MRSNKVQKFMKKKPDGLVDSDRGRIIVDYELLFPFRDARARLKKAGAAAVRSPANRGQMVKKKKKKKKPNPQTIKPRWTG